MEWDDDKEDYFLKIKEEFKQLSKQRKRLIDCEAKKHFALMRVKLMLTDAQQNAVINYLKQNADFVINLLRDCKEKQNDNNRI